MDRREKVIQHYIGYETIHYLIGRSFFVYAKKIWRFFLSLAVSALLYRICTLIIERTYLDILFGSIGIVVYIRVIIALINDYLDVVVLTDTWIVIMTRNGFFMHKIERLQRWHIQTISEEQDGFRDMIFDKGELVVSVDQGIVFPFHDIQTPKKAIKQILHRRNVVSTDKTPVETDKFQLLVETLGEVITDYMKIKKDPEDY